MKAEVRSALPALAAHEGYWDGVYRHVTRDFELLDQHRMRTWCEFPDEGPWAYVQHNHLVWPDGTEERRSFGGILRDGKLWWDTDRFSGWGWQAGENIILLSLLRKDIEDSRFTEMIEISPDGAARARTWQWFEAGQPVRRTLCDETRIEGPW